MAEIIYIDVISAARICSAVSLAVGFLISLMVTIPGAIYGVKTFFTDYSAVTGGAVIISAISDIILMTILFTILGLVAGAVISMVYNSVCLVLGGIEIEIIGEEIFVEERPEIKQEDDTIGYE